MGQHNNERLKSLLEEICASVNEIFVELELLTGRNGCVLINVNNLEPNCLVWTEDSLEYSHLVALRIPKSIALPETPNNQLPNSHDVNRIHDIVKNHDDFESTPDIIDVALPRANTY